ncbi:cobalamin trafficking protein CblD-like isoform X3 [Dysidea avara]
MLTPPSSYGSLAEARQALANLGLYKEFLLPGGVGVDIQSLIRPECEVVWESSVDAPPQILVECQAQECPEFLLAGFLELFVGLPANTPNLTMLTLTEHTSHDMMEWSVGMAQEREELLHHFIESAKVMCTKLIAAGYWADFIDPSSGRAFYSPHSNAVLTETDDRYRYFGFEVLDLGCCKCISHHLWGTRTFVGSLFTDAPSNCDVVQGMMNL